MPAPIGLAKCLCVCVCSLCPEFSLEQEVRLSQKIFVASTKNDWCKNIFGPIEVGPLDNKNWGDPSKRGSKLEN